MRILLVANYKPDHQESMARYSRLLHRGLQQRGYAVQLIYPSPLAARFVDRDSPLFRWLAYLDKFVFFPPVLWFRSRGADIVHICDHSNSFYLAWTGKAASLITAHDALAIRSALGHFPQNPTRWSGVKLQRWILKGLARAQNIVCVSEKTRRDFENLLPGDATMTVIPNPPDRKFMPARAEDVAAVREACGLAAEDEYLLHVGKDSWYKNRPGVLRIMAELKRLPRFERVKLVMAGNSLGGDLAALARQVGDVVECVQPSDEQLQSLYTGALALLFPSVEEGFGWPILEAQACGCLVITTARSPMMDVARGAAILIEPENPAAAAAAIAERIHEADSLRQAGLENVQRYSLNDAMNRYCDLYQQLHPTSETLSVPA
jgi:glycosyltransferase involved in cell wall biosynthesis